MNDLGDKSEAVRDLTRVAGLSGASKGWYLGSLLERHASLLILCRDAKEAEELAGDIQFFTPQVPVTVLPGWDSLPYEMLSPPPLTSAERVLALYRLSTAPRSITVTSVQCAMQRIMSPQELLSSRLVLTPGPRHSIDDLAPRLKAMGYFEVSVVEEIGEIAVRGSVIDLFPAGSQNPLRLTFSSNGLLSVKYFDPESQRTIRELTEVELLPVREHPRLRDDPQRLEPVLQRLRTLGKELDTPPREIVRLLNALKTDAQHPGIEMLLPYLVDNPSSVFSYLRPDTALVLANEIELFQSAEEHEELIEDRYARLSAEHYLIPKPEEAYLPPEELRDLCRQLGGYRIDHLEVGTRKRAHQYHTASLLQLRTELKASISKGEGYSPLLKALHSWRRKGYELIFAVGSHARAERLQRLLLNMEIHADLLDRPLSAWLRDPRRYPVVIATGHLSAGVTIEDAKLVVVAEQEIFAERSYRSGRRSKISIKKLLSSLGQLKEDDFVVHADYGIGVYRGLVHLEVESAEGDFLLVEYADSKLYLPVQQIAKVQKFAAAEGQVPVIDKLGSTRWIRTKEKVREAVLPLAADLIKLYASRSVAKGLQYDPAGAEDERFADDFPFDETPDQLKAIGEVLSDMAREKPMDRLVCGDVGFGKTEVALRAAWKALQHGRQVAVLVPTTILAEQHTQTFSSRLSGYPVKVASVSRFATAAENRKTLELLANGSVDVIVGTHRLLQRDVQFHDLGLAIIDEEHRFGVRQKERLKALRKQVDVLTLTATPIPRTLHMSLLGIRDISVIATAPTDRRVIKTYVSGFDQHVVRDAVLRELQRGGQCFYIHNRVQSIGVVCERLRELIPEARIEFAHGQMSEHELEEIMRRFLSGQTQVLVSTTIVESGLDIPNANTIIIERADTFGLAQLYQLRGRVGRSTRQAFAYLFIPKARRLGSDAQARLKALQALDDLGLGFNLAIRDLEIRGAGNLLGKEQSGNVLMVGFELYTKILREAVTHLKGDETEVEEELDPEVKLNLRAFIPEHYIPDISERLVLYQRLAAAGSSAEIDDLAVEIEDRFGRYGPEVFDLLEVMRIRALLRRFGVERIEQQAARITLYLSRRAPLDATKLLKLASDKPELYQFGRRLSFSLTLPKEPSPSQLYATLLQLLPEVAAGSQLLN